MDIKKCPFCGGEKISCVIEKTHANHVFSNSEYAYMCCYRCGTNGPHHWKNEDDKGTYEYALKQWNERKDWITQEKLIC